MMRQTFVLNRIKDVLWVLAMAGLVAGVGRMLFGLGVSTNMTDGLPWGAWKIVNMVAGAALATGGFITACVIYIFKMEKYRPMARIGITVGFLGYGSSLFALLFDIGLPHRFWHPFFMWNEHSFLFEVFWCVSCYWGVTALEMLPVVTERLPLPRITHFFHEIALPFIVLGITLSTMHHSSLGSLFMVSPTRLHPLWYTTWIPVEFFTSAMGAGMSVLVFITIACSWLYGKGRNMPLITGMAKGSAALLLVYAVIKAADFTVHNKWSYVVGGNVSWETYVWLIESALFVAIPVLIYLAPKTRNSAEWLTAGSLSAAVGLVMHRVDTGIVGYFRDAGQVYYPSLSEIFLSTGVFAAAGLFFLFLTEHFYVLESPEECAVPEAGGHPDKAPQWTKEEFISVFTSENALRASIIIVIVIPLAIIAMRNQATGPFHYKAQPVLAPTALDPLRDTLVIDGDRKGELAHFPHRFHQEELGGEESCEKCHHLDMPKDQATACHRCHKDMGLASSIFDHEYHQRYYGGNTSCKECHDPDKPKGPENAKACIECHLEDMDGMEKYAGGDFNHLAPSYKDAMHGTCLTCHRLHERLLPEEDPSETYSIGNCKRCHDPEGYKIIQKTAMAK